MIGGGGPGHDSSKVPGMRVMLAAAFIAALACGREAPTPTPTPGPAARLGGTLDRTWTNVQGQVADVLLLTRIRVALLERLKEDGLRVTIEVKGGKVDLSGQVEKSENVELAERVAGSVRGVRTLRSQVALAPAGQALEPPIAHALGTAERAVADALLEARVKARLLEELGKVAFDLEVEAREGIVSLSGTVPDAARGKLAVDAAKGTEGVKELRDHLTVERKEKGKTGKD
jgi:hyperosmotically inducible protein